MTAFARAGAPAREGNWNIEIRSVNHRYFEFSLKIPSALTALENRVRDRVQPAMRRGKVTVAISQELSADQPKALSIDEKAARFYLDSIQKLKKKFKLAGDVSVGDLLRLPGIFGAEESIVDPEKKWPQISKVLNQALEQAVKARQAEGKKLAQDIEARLEVITKAVGKIEHYAAGASEKIFKKLKGRIKTDGEVGRELDFLCQEMNREVNTMGSKSQFFEISTEVILIKGELEKIREQIQNIE